VFSEPSGGLAEIVDRDLDAGVIVEDDVGIDPANFSAALRFVLEIVGGGDYVRFPWRDHKDSGPTIAAQGKFSLREPRHVGLGMLAQVVGRDAAARLLAATGSFDRPVDTFLQMRWAHHVRMLALTSVKLEHLDAKLGGTTLHRGGRSLREKLAREALRARYRASVALRNLTTRAGIMNAGPIKLHYFRSETSFRILAMNLRH
jgi:GR25 family glycosyltransferase involved in LPS biosynthesis